MLFQNKSDLIVKPRLHLELVKSTTTTVPAVLHYRSVVVPKNAVQSYGTAVLSGTHNADDKR